jgi:DNA phosphorothioation-associated putative methyltransferase
VSEALYEVNRDVLDGLVAFVQARGRVPEHFELPEADELKRRFGSVKAALAVVRRVTGDDTWRAAHAAAVDDLTVYLALAAFSRRPKFGGLPDDVQVDVRTFYGSYKEACSAADDLLFGIGDQEAIAKACAESDIGKLTADSLYVHVGSVTRLAPILRVYDGSAKALVGSVEGTTLVKLNRLVPKVSYLSYPAFDRDPHPALESSVRADLRRLDVRFRDFRSSKNPPILHRKETFVTTDYPSYSKFARLTRQEERLDLLTDVSTIGTRDRWNTLIVTRGLQFRGHQLVRAAVSHGSNLIVNPTQRAPTPDVEKTSVVGPEQPTPDFAHPRELSSPVRPTIAVQRCRHGVALGSCVLCRT